jgi:small subunit ribosomal protein S1
VTSGPNWLEIKRGAWPLKAIDLDCNHIPDAAMTLGVLALYADGPTTLRNIASWRVKETDRIAAMARELRKLGATVEEGTDFIRVTPPATPAHWKTASIHTYDDHRVAMCFSLAAFNPAGLPVRIEDPKCVAKTFPDYFEALFSLAQAAPGRIPVICVDGPSASGKGTLAGRVAERLGYHYLDSGALYRVAAHAAVSGGLSLEPGTNWPLPTWRGICRSRFSGDQVLLDGSDVTDAIRSEEGGMNASRVSTMPAVRAALVALQQGFSRLPGLVADGRDMGTVIFPSAPLKVFLTASAAQRAERRHKQLISKGISTTLDSLRADLEARDTRDSTRSVAPLKPAADALQLDNSALTIEESVETVLRWWQAGSRSGLPERLAGVFTGLAQAHTAPARLTRTGCVVRQPNPRAKPASNRRSQPQQTMAIPLSYDLFDCASGKSMSESFAALFEESLQRTEMRPGEVITAEVVRIEHSFVVVNAGLKSEAYVPLEEFKNDKGEIEVQVGDFVSVAIGSIENGYGDTILSRDTAKRLASWMSLEKALESGEFVTGTTSGKVKGGLTVLVNGIRAFLPGSLVDTRPIKDLTPYENKTLEFKVIKLDRKRNNVVLSRRAVVEASMGEERAKLMETLKEGSVVQGVVKNITEYGAFVDLGGIDGLLHITDMAWRRVRHPSEVVTAGQEITAKILKFDTEKNRVSLGLKQMGDDPWMGVNRRYPQGTRMFGKITNIADYGAFVELEPGIEGLVHVSEMDWTNKNVAPSKIVALGDEVEVMVLEIDEDKRRISLGMKQCKANPWQEFAQNTKRGDRVKGPIKSITDFGVFVGLAAGIDGLVHLSDLSWNEPAKPPCATTRRARKSKPSCWPWTWTASASPWASSSWTADPFTTFVSVQRQGFRGDRQGQDRGCQGRRDRPGRRHHGLPARLGNLPRPRGRCPQRAQGRRRSVRRGGQHGSQDPQHPAVDQGQGHGRPERSHGQPEPAVGA